MLEYYLGRRLHYYVFLMTPLDVILFLKGINSSKAEFTPRILHALLGSVCPRIEAGLSVEVFVGQIFCPEF